MATNLSKNWAQQILTNELNLCKDGKINLQSHETLINQLVTGDLI